MINIAAYGFALVVFFLADMAWLGTMAPRLYWPTLGDIMLSGVNLAPAALFYLLYPIGLVIFAISPALKNESVATAALYGALFGLFTYATYDLSNQATLRNWSATLSLVDIGWGTLLGCLSASMAYWLTAQFVP